MNIKLAGPNAKSQAPQKLETATSQRPKGQQREKTDPETKDSVNIDWDYVGRVTKTSVASAAVTGALITVGQLTDQPLISLAGLAAPTVYGALQAPKGSSFRNRLEHSKLHFYASLMAARGTNSWGIAGANGTTVGVGLIAAGGSYLGERNR